MALFVNGSQAKTLRGDLPMHGEPGGPASSWACPTRSKTFGAPLATRSASAAGTFGGRLPAKSARAKASRSVGTEMPVSRGAGCGKARPAWLSAAFRLQIARSCSPISAARSSLP